MKRDVAMSILSFLNIDPTKVDNDIDEHCRTRRDIKSFHHCNIRTVGKAVLEFNRTGGYPPNIRSKSWRAFIANLQETDE